MIGTIGKRRKNSVMAVTFSDFIRTMIEEMKFSSFVFFPTTDF
jgi:hypothetical protein